MNSGNSMTEQLTSETEPSVEEKLAKIAAMLADKQARDGQPDDAPKAQLAPFTCPIDPAERAACDSCQ